ncbi:MFS transporter [Candidatus Micrarchaeota archaeon]|nr:MFS transporter [Candidatus Micrarchaeota archaeon]
MNERASWLNRTVLGASLTSFLSDFSHETVTVMLPSFLAILGAPAYALGLIEGVSDGLSSFAKLFSGYYSDKLGKRKELAVLGYLATGMFPAFVALSSTWPMVLFSRAFAWIGRGIRGPPKDAILSSSVEEKDLGKAFGFHRTADTLGAIMGPLLGYVLLSYFDIRQIFFFAVIPGMFAAIVFWFSVKDSKVAPSNNKKGIVLSLTELPDRFRSFLYAVFFFGAADFSHTLLIFFAVAQLTPSLGFVAASATSVLLFGIRNVAYALMCYPFGVLGDKFGKKKILVVGYALAVVTFVGFIVCPIDPILYGVLFALSGAFIAAEDTLEGAVAGELVEKERRALGYGALATVNGVGDFISSLVVGVLWSIFGFGAGFMFSAIVGLIGTLMLLRTNHVE